MGLTRKWRGNACKCTVKTMRVIGSSFRGSGSQPFEHRLYQKCQTYPTYGTGRGDKQDSAIRSVLFQLYTFANPQHTMAASLVAAPISTATFLASRPAVRRSRAAHVKVSR